MITHPDKVLFPDDGITKGEVAEYYAMVSKVMLPHLRGRPITMERFPAGIGAKGFLQKSVVKGFPSWLKRIEAPKKGGTVLYPLANDARSLEWIANQNTITIHVWPSRAPKIDRPDLCVFDLDPSKDEPEVLRAAALGLRDVLGEMGLTSWVKTTGSKGFHIVVPTKPKGRATFGTTTDLANRVPAILIQRNPTILTQAFSKADRGGKIFVDTARNHPGQTFAAAYTIRARPGAPVSAPCTWAEIEKGRAGPQSFNVRNMARRLKDAGDLWSEL